MSTIACPRCRAVFPLAQVAQFDQFTCGACGAVIPVPMATPVPTVAPITPAARPATPRPAQAPPAQAQPTRPAQAQPARPAQAQPARPAGPSAALPPAAARAAQARPAPAPTPQPRPAARPQPAVPAAAAARPQAARPQPARPQPVTEIDEPEDESPRRGRRGERETTAKKPPVMMWAGIGGGALLLIVVAFLVMKGGSSGTDPATPGSGGANGAPVPDQAAAPTADPEKDPAAWKALPPEARKEKANWKLAQLDPKKDWESKLLHDFFLARDEKDAAMSVARDVLKAKPETEWAHITLGHTDLRELVEACIRDCQWGDGLGTDSMKQLQTLRKTRGPKSGPWYADEELGTRVKDLVAQIREEEKSLSTPFGQGVAKWVNYHRSIEVMRDFPAIHGTVGPYLVFVSLPVAPEKVGKDVTLADVTDEDLKKGREILDRTLKLYGQFYDAWHKELGPIFGFTKYGPDNADQETTLLVNVFTSQKDYERYNAKAGGASGARAFYSIQEPRFITTYDGPGLDKVAEQIGEDTAQVQCHEGTHQVRHLYTWDLVRKTTNRKPEWLAVARHPMWSEEGFAEFFASYTDEGGTLKFMQPLEERLWWIWQVGKLLENRKWDDWKLRELLEPYHTGQAQIYAQSRVRKPEDAGIAGVSMVNLFYAEAWSLCYFMWNYEEGGKLKYRDRYIEYLKYEFTPKVVRDPSGREYTDVITPNHFRRYLGITDDAKYAEFDKEWRAWLKGFVKKHEKPEEWEKKRKILWDAWGLRPDGTHKPPEPKKPTPKPADK